MWWLLACTAAPPDPTAGWTGGVTTAPDPVPGRFSGPVSLAFGPEDRPLEALRHGVCHDRPGVRDALLAAIAATDPADRGAWATVTGDVDCDAPGWCPWVRERLAAAPPSDRAAWVVGLWSCRDPESARALLSEAPDEVATAWLAASQREAPVALPWVDRLEALARAASEDPSLAEPVLRAVASLPDPRGRALVRRLAETQDGVRRDRSLAALDGTLDPGEALLVERACAALGRDCVGRAAATDLHDAVARGLDPRGLPARYPHLGEALRDALAQCVLGPDAWVAHRCAEALADLDPERAAVALAAGPHAEALRDVVVDEAAARAALEACGWSGGGEAPLAGRTVADLLVADGHALRVRAVSADDEGPGLPYRLATLAGLDDADFDTLGPGSRGARAWFGWRGGVRHRAVGDGADGWDVAPAVRLVNDLLARADRPERVVPESSHTTFVLGRPDALGCLAAEGLAAFATAPVPQEAP